MMRYQVGDKVRKIRLRRDFQRWDNTYVLDIDWFTVTGRPPEATVPKRGRDYKGIMFTLKFKTPVWVERWR